MESSEWIQASNFLHEQKKNYLCLRIEFFLNNNVYKSKDATKTQLSRRTILVEPKKEGNTGTGKICFLNVQSSRRNKIAK